MGERKRKAFTLVANVKILRIFCTLFSEVQFLPVLDLIHLDPLVLVLEEEEVAEVQIQIIFHHLVLMTCSCKSALFYVCTT